MKPLFIIIISLLPAASFSQPCATGGKIQSPAVARLTEMQSIISNNCDAVTISWRGNEGQSYIVSAVYTDQSTGKASATDNAPPVAVDNALNCSVTIPLKPGSTLSWTLQAVQTIDSRTFYSYPLRGEAGSCEKEIIAEKSKEAVSKPGITVLEDAAKSGLAVFPNPVTGELTINWASDYRGKANLAILDASGKPVKVMDIRKEQHSYIIRQPVHTYSSGVYIVYIGMHNGKSISTRFVKN